MHVRLQPWHEVLATACLPSIPSELWSSMQALLTNARQASSVSSNSSSSSISSTDEDTVPHTTDTAAPHQSDPDAPHHATDTPTLPVTSAGHGSDTVKTVRTTNDDEQPPASGFSSRVGAQHAQHAEHSAAAGPCSCAEQKTLRAWLQDSYDRFKDQIPKRFQNLLHPALWYQLTWAANGCTGQGIAAQPWWRLDSWLTAPAEIQYQR